MCMPAPETDAFGDPTSNGNARAHGADPRSPVSEGSNRRPFLAFRWSSRVALLLLVLALLLVRFQGNGRSSLLIVFLVVLFASRLLLMFSMSRRRRQRRQRRQR